MLRKYHSCFFCKGEVKEELETVDYRWGEELVTVLKNVPAGVCQVCGEQHFKAEIVEAMEKSSQSSKEALKTIEIPVKELHVA